MIIWEWDILCLCSGCVVCNVTFAGTRKALAAVAGTYVLPVAGRGQGKGLTLPFQAKTTVDFYSLSFCVLRDWSTGLLGSAAGESICPKVLRSP